MPSAAIGRPQSFIETHSDSDLHQLLIPTPTNETPQPRDTADSSSDPSSDAGSFFVPEPLSRTNSAYSFSRASLSSQLGSLTSMSLPQAESLAANIRALSTAKKAIRALNSSAEQIMSWTKRALKVLHNLDADDDVEWAAEAGREALTDTEKTINQFEHLISVYVLSIEELQSRRDIAEIKHEDLSRVVEQMEMTLDSWENVRQSLKKLHSQVELAMEWEELWNTVLADVGMELDNLSQLVFGMEEKRHKAYIEHTTPMESSQNIDLNELESFMDDPAAKKKKDMANPRFSMTFEVSPLDSPAISSSQDDTELLVLFARMQPLRASLDFLPMRLSMFEQRAQSFFPNACKELKDKREHLENSWAQLSEGAETLRRELSEDRWIMVFRNAGRQAQKMLNSIERSIIKVQEAIDEGYQRTNPSSLGKRIESFEAKKMHYMPAVQRVLAIIQKGLKDRLTVNGEILRLNWDLGTKSRELEDAIASIARQLEPVTPIHNKRLRESISSIVSFDKSFSSGTMAGTPGSSPASSIDLPHNNHPGAVLGKYAVNVSAKPRSTSTTRGPPISSNNRRTSLQPRRPTTPLGTTFNRRGVSPAPASVYRQGVYKPPVASAIQRPASTVPGDKPRWSAIVSPGQADKSSNLSVNLAPSTQRKFPPRAASSLANHHSVHQSYKSPLSREATSSPPPQSSQAVSYNNESIHGFGRSGGSNLKSFAERAALASSNAGMSALMNPIPYPKSRTTSNPIMGSVRSPSSLGTSSLNRSSLSGTTSSATSSIPTRPSSVLRGQYHTPRPASRSSIPIRAVSGSSPKYPSRSPRSSLDSARGGPDIVDEEPEELPVNSATNSTRGRHNHEDDRYTDQGSSPLAKRTPRPPSSVGMGSTRGGKRQSMLPVPVNGRLSSMGHRHD